MSLNKNNISYEIKNMDIYKRDYDIINNLIKNVEPSLFSVILEEVMNNNMSWSDFEQILSHTDYSEILKLTLESQKKIKNELYNFNQLNDLDDKDNNLLTNIGLTEYSSTNAGKELYEKEYRIIRENLIFNLLKIDSRDNDLSILCKLKLYEMVMNGFSDEENKTSENALNIDDIFLFLDSYIIPIDSRFQQIDDLDRTFMNENNLDEKTMKHFKQISALIRRYNYIGGLDE